MTTTHTTPYFNASDWTGEEIAVAYKVAENGTIAFEMNGYRFEISPLDNTELPATMRLGGEGWRTLHGDQWQDELTTLFFIDQDGRDAETAVIRAARYVRNHV